MQQNTYLTKDQFTKLECDSHAYLEIALTTESHITKIQCFPTSTAGISLSTVMMTNLGMSIELKLKALYYKTTNTTHPPAHGLITIYDSLDNDIKLKLTRIFNELLSENPNPKNIAIGYIHSKIPLNPPNFQYEGFRGILEFLDHVGLYSRRYSFENFSYNDWWFVISPKILAPLINKITQFTNDLADPIFKQ